jgi:phenylacetate-CoA ligase
MPGVTLQAGLYALCKNRIAEDEEFKATAAYHNFDAVDDALFDKYRLFQLQRELRLVNEKSTFYKRRFMECGVTPDLVQSLPDLARMPFTAPMDLADNSYRFLCTSQSYVEKPVTFYSSGSTGMKKRIFFSRADLQKILDFLPRGMNTVIGREECRAQVFLQNSQGRGIGGILAQSLRQFGMQAWTSNLADDPEKIIALTLENHVNVWFGEAITILRATRILAKKIDLSKLGMQCIFITMTNIPDCMVEYLKKTWNCRVSTHYGLTEMGWGLAVDCDRCDGYHYNELDVIAEVVDPASGEVLPAGESGEIVLTSIARDCMPLIRYRTEDIATLRPCECGGHMELLGHIQRRREGTVSMNGREIYPALFDEPIFGVEDVLDYRLLLREDRLRIEVETLRGGDEICREVAEAVMRVPELSGCKRPEVTALPCGALRPYCFEKKRIQTET